MNYIYFPELTFIIISVPNVGNVIGLLRGVHKMPFPKPCDRCGEKFQPQTAHNRLCDDCRAKTQNGKRKTKPKEILQVH